MTVKPLMFAAVLISALLAGCSSVKPWQREYLADEIMQADANVVQTEWHIHVEEVLEGSRGGFSGSGGGCGCR
ncbi:MAG: DUF4266 domain-containing protein [Nitrospirota bacterium]